MGIRVLQRNRASRVCVCAHVRLSINGRVGAFILKNWLTELCRLASPKCTGLADEDLGEEL